MGLLDFITGDDRKKGDSSQGQNPTKTNPAQQTNTSQSAQAIYPMPTSPVPSNNIGNLQGSVPPGNIPMAKTITPERPNMYAPKPNQQSQSSNPVSNPSTDYAPQNLQNAATVSPTQPIPPQADTIQGRQNDADPQELDSINDLSTSDPNSLMSEYQKADPYNDMSGNAVTDMLSNNEEDQSVEPSREHQEQFEGNQNYDQQSEKISEKTMTSTSSFDLDLPAIDFNVLKNLPNLDAKTNSLTKSSEAGYVNDNSDQDSENSQEPDNAINAKDFSVPAEEVNETLLQDQANKVSDIDEPKQVEEPETSTDQQDNESDSKEEKIVENIEIGTQATEATMDNQQIETQGQSNETNMQDLQEIQPVKVEKEHNINPKVKKIFRKIALIGLAGKAIDQATGEAVKVMTKDLLRNNIDIMIDSRTGYGEHVLQASLAFGKKVTGVYLRPYLSNDFSVASKQLNENDSFSVIYSNYLERLRHFAKDARLFVVFENSGIHNLSSFLVLWSVSKMYLGQHKPLILVGAGWKDKLSKLKEMFSLSENVMQVVSIVNSPRDVLPEIDRLNTRFAKKKDFVKVEKVVDRRVEGDEKDFIVY
ncbi:MAG: hypothetical protein Kow0081_3550 [Candidatus Dojkabacteria bacterium]